MIRTVISHFAKVIVAFTFSCQNSSVSPTIPGTWDKLSDFPGIPRRNAVGFVINGIAFVGTGYNYASNKNLTDFWSYTKSTDSWTATADFPGVGRSYAVAFSLNGKGYVGLGTDGMNPLSDFYQYDPSLNKWTSVADFGTSPSVTTALSRFGAIAFNVNGKAFVGSGSANTPDALQDFWQYDHVQNQWLRIQDIGLARRNAWVMVVGNIAYLGGGSNNGTTLNDLWKFDSSLANPWGGLEKKGVQPPSRELATTFTIENNGYLSFGSNNTAVLFDAWQYSPHTNQWIQVKNTVTSLGNTWNGMASRASGIGFSIENVGYMTTGSSGNICYDDCWMFNP